MILRYTKFIVALFTIVSGFLAEEFNVGLGFTPEQLQDFLFAITPFVVLFFPNRSRNG